jgi:hypothetical protein
LEQLKKMEVKAMSWCNEKLDYIIEKEQIEMNIKKARFYTLPQAGTQAVPTF